MGISLFDSSKKEDKLRPIFALMLRRSSGHHPLLAGALSECHGWAHAMLVLVWRELTVALGACAFLLADTSLLP